jgi:hypothetical protein
MKALVSLLEGRNDHVVHDTLADKLETTLLRARMVAIFKEYNEFYVLKRKTKKQPVEKKDEKDNAGEEVDIEAEKEEFLDEGCDLFKMVNYLENSGSRSSNLIRQGMLPLKVPARVVAFDD